MSSDDKFSMDPFLAITINYNTVSVILLWQQIISKYSIITLRRSYYLKQMVYYSLEWDIFENMPDPLSVYKDV